MSFYYLNGKKWSQITRDERFFCAELYFEIKANIPKFLMFLNRSKLCHLEDADISSEWEVGFEVCFYRDYIAEFHKEEKGRMLRNRKMMENIHSPKRTFDITLFSNKYLIIIEAKCFEGFSGKQLQEFVKEKQLIRQLLVDPPEIVILALHSSVLKNFKKTTKESFDNMFTWRDISELYPENRHFKRANREVDC